MSLFYEIRIRGSLNQRWFDWFDGLTISNSPEGFTTLSGLITDQASLYGVLERIHDLNLTLISVNQVNQPDKSPDQLQ
jgi:hypothetical protein